VIDKKIDEQGRHLIQVKHRMADQKGSAMAIGTAEIELPKR
jgi:hypothetical protein